MGGIKIPSYDAPTTSISSGGLGGFDPGVSDGRAATIAGQQMQQTGQDLSRATQQGINVEAGVLDQANQIRVDDALNQVRQKAMDLTYDPEAGYANIKGGAALNRPDGIALPDEYSQKLGTSVADVSATLANDEQRRQFQVRAAQLETGFKGDVEGHMLKEFTTYHNSVADGNQKLSVMEAQANWDKPDKVRQAIDGTPDPETGVYYGGIKNSIYQKAKLNGLSATEAQAAMNTAVSDVHASVIQTALTNSNVTYADGYFNKYKSEMTADDILKVQGQVNAKMDAHVALDAVSNTQKQYSSAINPTGMTRLTGIVATIESNNNKNAVGPYVKGQGTAKGSMQVMDATNLDPGFGVTPAKDNSPEERARVGQEYIGAMVRKYADPAKALAAYNAGPGTVDAALEDAKKAGDENNWMNYLKDHQSPENNQQTMNYVMSGMKQYNAGVGAPAMPTKTDFVQTAVAKLGDSPRIEALTATREQAEKQYDLIMAGQKEKGEQALSAAQKELIANGGSFNDLTPATRDALAQSAPENYDNAMKFAKSISSDNVTTDPNAYMVAIQNPAQLAAMSDPQFLQFVKTNFARADQDKIINLRQEYASGSASDAATSIANETVNSVINDRLKSIGINPTPSMTGLSADEEGAARVAGIHQFIRDAIYAQQNQLGRKMNPKETEDFINSQFAKSVAVPGSLWGTNQENLMSMKPEDIPSQQRAVLRNKFIQRGIAEPTDEQILQAYRKLATNGKGNTNG